MSPRNLDPLADALRGVKHQIRDDWDYVVHAVADALATRHPGFDAPAFVDNCYEPPTNWEQLTWKSKPSSPRSSPPTPSTP